MSAPTESTPAPAAPAAPEPATLEPAPALTNSAVTPSAPEPATTTSEPAADAAVDAKTTEKTVDPPTADAAAAPETDAKPVTNGVTKPKAMKEIVVLGVGYAGIACAHYILRHIVPALPERETYHVSVVDPSSKWVNRVAAPRSLVSEKLLPLSKWILDTEVGFKEYSAEKFSFVQGKATAMDITARTVTIEKTAGGTETLTYYALLIATGASSATPLFGTPGPHTLTISAIEAFREKLPEAKQIVIAGGGPAAVETAGELGHYINGRAGFFSARPKTIKTKITVVTSAAKLLPILRPALALKAERLLAKVGVDVVYSDAVVSTEPPTAGKRDADGSLGSFLSPAQVKLASGKVLEADLYIPAYGLTANASWAPAELRDESGRIITNKQTLRVEAAGPRVYAVGEVGNYGIGGIFEIMFSAISTSMINMKRDLLHDAKVAASGDEKLAKSGKDMTFENKAGESQMVPVGRRSGVGALFGWKVPGFTVWLIKGRQYLTEMNNSNLAGSSWKKETKWKHA